MSLQVNEDLASIIDPIYLKRKQIEILKKTHNYHAKWIIKFNDKNK